jgi:hypothetical protein
MKSCPRRTVSLALTRASAAELTWAAVEGLDDAELKARLYPSAVAAAAAGKAGLHVDPSRATPRWRDVGAFAPRAAPRRASVHVWPVGNPLRRARSSCSARAASSVAYAGDGRGTLERAQGRASRRALFSGRPQLLERNQGRTAGICQKRPFDSGASTRDRRSSVHPSLGRLGHVVVTSACRTAARARRATLC